MTDNKAKNIYTSNLQPLKLQKKKKGIRVQFVNQDLDQAIKQIKQSVKNKSSIQKNSKIAAQHQQQNTNPENIQRNGQSNGNKLENQKLFYTQNYKKKVEARLYEIQQRRKQLNAKSLEKQMKARLLRKIQQNIELKQKMDILKDVQQRRELLILDKTQREKRRKQEQKMLHESSIVNAEMFRKTKKKNIKNQLKDSRVIQQQSLKNLHFKNFMTQKQKQEKRMQLHFRHEFIIRNKSSKGLRDQLISSRTYRTGSTVSLNRGIKTSHLSRRNQLKSQFEQQQLIIQQYKHNPKQKNQKVEQNQQKVQKKYNSLVRQSQKNSSQGQSQRQSQRNSKLNSYEKEEIDEINHKQN